MQADISKIVRSTSMYSILNRHARQQSCNQTVLMITKYPPVIGGVSSQEYWKSLFLLHNGFNVIVLTSCIEDASGCCIPGRLKELELHTNLTCEGRFLKTFYISPSYGDDGRLKRECQHIPSGNMHFTKLLGLGRMLLGMYDVDIIYSGYLEPYGVVANVLAEEYQLPHLLSFAGSDLNRLTCSHEVLQEFSEVFRNADLIMAGWERAQRLLCMSASFQQLSLIPFPVFLPPSCFYNTGCHIPFSVGIFGKHGMHKKESVIIAAIAKRADISLHYMQCGSRSLDEALFSLRGLEITASRFPWEMADFLNTVSLMFFFEEEFDVREHMPISAIEAGLCGVCVVFSETMYRKMHRVGFELNVNCMAVDTVSEGAIDAVLQNDAAYIRQIGDRASSDLQRTVNQNLAYIRTVFEQTAHCVSSANTTDPFVLLQVYFPLTCHLYDPVRMAGIIRGLDMLAVKSDIEAAYTIGQCLQEHMRQIPATDKTLFFLEAFQLEWVKLQLYYEQHLLHKAWKSQLHMLYQQHAELPVTFQITKRFVSTVTNIYDYISADDPLQFEILGREKESFFVICHSNLRLERLNGDDTKTLQQLAQLTHPDKSLLDYARKKKWII